MPARAKFRLIAAVLGAVVLAIGLAVWHDRSEPETPVSAPVPETPTPPTSAVAPESPRPARPEAPAAAAPNGIPDAAPPSARVEATVARMNEAVLMAHLREVARTDSALTIEIARAGNKKFPDSPDAPERYSILIHALTTQNQISEARGEAEYMVNHFPDSSWVRGIEGFTGAHRHRNIRVNDAGQLEYY